MYTMYGMLKMMFRDNSKRKITAKRLSRAKLSSRFASRLSPYSSHMNRLRVARRTKGRDIDIPETTAYLFNVGFSSEVETSYAKSWQGDRKNKPPMPPRKIPSENADSETE
eukprot:comp21466_c1_seq1/m.29707 comp21466_c1_seq1/g.29707  ORF comp21466_c1_seq1/g.29707 comp21466_c1_seq1/m.29707 type:complete len:111 (+) comp21466_c1_seq1:772-1104(+)